MKHKLGSWGGTRDAIFTGARRRGRRRAHDTVGTDCRFCLVVGRRVQPGAEAQSATDDDNDGLQLTAYNGAGAATDDDDNGLQLTAGDCARTGTGTAAARAGRPDLRVPEQHPAGHGTVAAEDDDTASGHARPPR
jgi:hypothetical protein